MSLYNQLMGENPQSDALLKMLDLCRDDFGRYRDIYLNATGTSIIVYTRCGGGNRPAYESMYDIIRNHPNYSNDWDDSFDSTYSYIEFTIPKRFEKDAKGMATGIAPETVQEKFDKEIKEMQIPGSPAAKRAEEIAKKIQDGIDNNPNGGIIWM